ncbi:hypothetical protein GEMRC1_008833 [Eukaryota sp. GEM-RC1]
MSTQQFIDKPLVWFDGEYTGLNISKDRVLEYAVIITDSDLNVVDTLGPIVLHQSDELLATMDEWCTRTHTDSGLVAKVKESSVTEGEAQTLPLRFHL